MRTALSESTVLGVVMAVGSAIVLPRIFKAGDSFFHSVSSRLALIPGQHRMHSLLLRAPWRPSLLDNRDDCSWTDRCLCAYVCMLEMFLFFYLHIFLF